MALLNIYAMADKDFDAWNVRKKAVHAIPQQEQLDFSTREIWWCTIGLNIGVEIDGKQRLFLRPVIILKKFNQDMFWGIPLTSKKKEGFFYLPVTHNGMTSWAILNQLRIFSSKRLFRIMGKISKENFINISTKLISLLWD